MDPKNIIPTNSNSPKTPKAGTNTTSTVNVSAGSSSNTEHRSSSSSATFITAPIPSFIHFITLLKNVFNSLVLLGSIVIIAALSFEIFDPSNTVNYTDYLKIQFWVCIIFLIDYLLNGFLAQHKLRYMWRNVIFLIVSIPYLTIANKFNINIPDQLYYIIKIMPLIRGGYGLAIMVGWATRSGIASLFFSYIATMISLVYFASITFYAQEKGINTMVETYGSALWWAFMTVTTVGSNIYAATTYGKVMSVILAGSGMMLFPIFTVYITNRFRADIGLITLRRNSRKPQQTESKTKVSEKPTP